MDKNVIFWLFIKIGLMIVFVILQIIAYKYVKANPLEAKIENTENSVSITIYHKNKFMFYLAQYLIPVIIILFLLCIFDIIYLLTNYKLNIFVKIMSIIIFMYIAYILFVKIISKRAGQGVTSQKDRPFLP